MPRLHQLHAVLSYHNHAIRQSTCSQAKASYPITPPPLLLPRLLNPLRTGVHRSFALCLLCHFFVGFGSCAVTISVLYLPCSFSGGFGLTGFLLFLECFIVFVDFFFLFLGRFKWFGFAAYSVSCLVLCLAVDEEWGEGGYRRDLCLPFGCCGGLLIDCKGCEEELVV